MHCLFCHIASLLCLLYTLWCLWLQLSVLYQPIIIFYNPNTASILILALQILVQVTEPRKPLPYSSELTPFNTALSIKATQDRELSSQHLSHHPPPNF